jgi:uncharacterized protein (TIGR02145 family)
MPLPSSGQISLGDIANEFDYELSNISLRTLSQKASKGQPDAVSEFYNFTYNYPTVQIVNQVWFSESLRRKKYVDGVVIIDGTTPNEWTDVGGGRYAFPNGTTINRNDYGLLYNFYAINNSSGSELCPAGFRPPLSSEVTSLINYVGVPSLKTVGTTYWNTANGTNTSGYGAMGSGWRSNNTTFSHFKNTFYWWASDQSFVTIGDDNSSGVSNATVNAGYSMRCMTLKSYYFLLLSNGGVYYYDMATNTINSLSLFSSGAVGIAMTNNKLWIMFDTSTGLNLSRFTINLASSPISVSSDTTLSYTPDVSIYNGIEKLTSDGSIMLIAGGDRIYTASTVSGGVISTTNSLPITGGSSRGGIALKNDYYVTITKTSGVDGVWDTQAYSTNGYVDRILISAKSAQTNAYIMFGLNSDPKTDASYTSLDYAWYFVNNGTLVIWENNENISSHGTYTTDTILSIIYENGVIKYYKDGSLVRSIARSVGLPLYFDSSMHNLNSEFYLTNYNTFFNIGKNPNIVGTNVTITPSTSGTIYSTFTAGGVQSVYQNSSVLHNISSIVNPFAMSCDASFIYIFANDLVYRFTDSIPPQRLNINGTDVVIPIPAETQIFGAAQI